MRGDVRGKKVNGEDRGEEHTYEKRKTRQQTSNKKGYEDQRSGAHEGGY